MEIYFLRYLVKGDEADALPLKQRIPEIAVFQGKCLKDGFFSNQRGLLQRRSGSHLSEELLLDRILALSAKTDDAADLNLHTPVAVLRRAALGGNTAGPPKAEVLNASQLMELLGRSGKDRFADEEWWSLQALVVPSTNLRIVAVYSRSALGEESLDVVGRSFSAVYALGACDPWQAEERSQSSASSNAAIDIPEALASAAEAKTLAMVQYVQQFHGHFVESLIVEFVSDTSGRAILHGIWKVDMIEGKRSPPESYSACHSPASSTALPSTVSHASFSQSRPASAASTSVECGPPSRPGSASRRAMQTSPQEYAKDLHIQEDEAEDDDIELAIERIRASARSTVASGRPPAAHGRPRPPVAAPPAAPCRPSSHRPRQPANGPDSKRPPSLSASRSAPMRPASVPRPPPSNSYPSRPAGARPQRSGSRPNRPSSAPSSRIGASGTNRSRPASAGPSREPSMTSRRQENTSLHSSFTPAHRNVVSGVQTSQLISRHISEREARPRLLSVLARQMERFREHVPAFAAQRNAVKALLAGKQRTLLEKTKEVEQCREQKLVFQRAYGQQYQLLVHGLQRQIQEAKAVSEDRRRQLEASLQGESDFARKIAGQKGQTEALRSAVDKTISQIEKVQQVVTQTEARAHWEPEEQELPELAKMYRQIEAHLREQKQVQEQVRLSRIHLRESEEALLEQRAYAKYLEDFIRKISAAGGRYVMPPIMRREAHRLLNSAAKLRAAAAREAAEREAIQNQESDVVSPRLNTNALRSTRLEPLTP
eukprot:TRINITY_DN31166_c0_g1_i1.p1 TRINITY_DN31166_c0_g1~~TRINITY_DN31166_c0_g1_i1.p1  ORF type:complete len:771 (+),score=117.31 TRINITY_DN31166_c0_g1_i1:124-2436(+)